MSFYEQVSANRTKTIGLFIIFFILVAFLGFIFSYFLGDTLLVLPIFMGFSILYLLISYFAGDKIVLAISSAKEADPVKYQRFHNVAEEMAIAAGIPKPKLYVINDTAMNAFATGRDPQHSVVCATTGLLETMNRDELQGVIAHEMSHIKNFDIRVMMLTAVLVSFTVLLSDLLLRFVFYGGLRSRDNNNKSGGLFLVLLVFAILLAIITPIIAQLIKFAISRSREYLADASAAELTRYPQGLASALAKISGDKEVLEAANKATAHLYIANPLKGQKLWMMSLFSTHPDINDRIKRLRAM
ncbi:MAG: zinc metalloprotease HtpX [Candidatus Diapherotrites archaeon CG08_land_8_20_14_0_20_34_12]|nr:MAG: zinc metalloprotease HtpX [Candidatus Diapherotrites archaeon CG08_land_8_20_14_0_20_34_12]